MQCPSLIDFWVCSYSLEPMYRKQDQRHWEGPTQSSKMGKELAPTDIMHQHYNGPLEMVNTTTTPQESSTGDILQSPPCHNMWQFHMPQQPLQNHPSGHLGGWVTLWSAEEMLDGRHGVDPELLKRASCRKGWRKSPAESSLVSPLTTQLVKGLNWTEPWSCLS